MLKKSKPIANTKSAVKTPHSLFHKTPLTSPNTAKYSIRKKQHSQQSTPAVFKRKRKSYSPILCQRITTKVVSITVKREKLCLEKVKFFTRLFEIMKQKCLYQTLNSVSSFGSCFAILPSSLLRS